MTAMMMTNNQWVLILKQNQVCLFAQLLRKGADKSLALPIFQFAAQPKEFVLDGLKKLEQGSRKCVELKGEYVNIFFQSRSLCSL
jgi:hypothetical protein